MFYMVLINKGVYFMKKIFAFFLCLLILTSCTNKEEKKVVCTGTINGTNITSILQSEGDDVQSETYEEIIDLSQIGYDAEHFNESEKQEVINLLTSKKYGDSSTKDKKGIRYNSGIDENNFVLSITVNYDEADLQDLKDLHLIESDGIINFGVSLEKTKENYEANGLICK